MSDIVERLEGVLNIRGDTYSSAEVLGMLAAAKAEIERLTAALREMVDCHGKPMREEWLNDAAYEHAQIVYAKARAALEGEDQTMLTKKMMAALKKDGEKLWLLTGQEHGPWSPCRECSGWGHFEFTVGIEEECAACNGTGWD